MQLVINFSGGKDSTALLAWVCENHPDVPKHVVMADTGWEHPDAIEWSRGIVDRFGLPLHVVRNPNKTLLSMAEKRGKFPGMQQRQCTSDLKRDPVNTWIRRNLTDPVIVSAMGLRAEESSSRAKLPMLCRDRRETNNRRTVWKWNPILHWKETEVWAYLREREIPTHPVYKHLRRFSCRVCIYMTDHDLRAVAKHDPEAIDLVAQVEDQIGFTMFQRGGVRELVMGGSPADPARNPSQRTSPLSLDRSLGTVP
jgi:3'-phosphoadenosine 5'-phosphosulfate sulfotransferase (PAPS reductase)/FAD synthetase